MNPLFQSQETIAGKVLGFVVISSYQELYGIAFIGVFFFVTLLIVSNPTVRIFVDLIDSSSSLSD
jgi:hypothetical protein